MSEDYRNFVASFEPSADRGQALDRRMRKRLAESLDYVFGELGRELGIDEDEGLILTNRIASAQQSPHAFGSYYELVFALENENLDLARIIARNMLSRSCAKPGIAIAAIDDRSQDDEGRYRRLMMTGMDYAVPPDDALMEAYEEQLRAAFTLLDSGFPQLAEEIRELLREIVVAAGPIDPKALTFDGASCYMLWGAVLLNARGQKSVLETAEALAHESGHNLLFGFCSSGPLVDNPDNELFSSPLRKDPRPMDGVFHATYVVARMHQTLTRLLQAEVLDSEQTAAAKADLELHRKNFEAGDLVVRKGARLTDVGRAAIEAAREYMASAA